MTMQNRRRSDIPRVLLALVAIALLPTAAKGGNVQVRLIRATPSGAMDSRLGDVAGALRSRGFAGGQLVADRTASVGQGKTAKVNLPESTVVEVTNEKESGGRTTLRVLCRGWGATVTLKDHPKNKPALIVGPQRGGGRLVLAVKPR